MVWADLEEVAGKYPARGGRSTQHHSVCSGCFPGVSDVQKCQGQLLTMRIFPRAQDSVAIRVPDQDTMTVADIRLMNIYQECNTTGMVWKSSAPWPGSGLLQWCEGVLGDDTRFLSARWFCYSSAEKQLWTACGWDARFAELLKVFSMSSWPVKSLIFQCQLP